MRIVLRPKERKCWEKAFEYYWDDEKMSGAEADQKAWEDTAAEFPRLRKYEGSIEETVSVNRKLLLKLLDYIESAEYKHYIESKKPRNHIYCVARKLHLEIKP